MKSNNHETHTIVVFDKVIEEQARHRNSTARKVWIIVHPFTYFDTSRRVNITSKEREQVVLPGVTQLKHLRKSYTVCAYGTTMASLNDQTKVGRERALVRSAGGLLVGVRAGQVI